MHRIERLAADNFERRVLSSPIPVVLAFGGDHCGPCRLLEPVLVELFPAIEGRVRVLKVDVRADSELATRLGIVALPTISFFRHRREECRLVGLQNRERLLEAVLGVLPPLHRELDPHFQVYPVGLPPNTDLSKP
ncbi:thioredoxin family protein [Limnoglobus roseus]|uniref:Thioredoxin n=1 Tax=Limnoglobus roseus TaxID=2598579 RepID=A0A5C1AHX4_9BACT|nr:thioredoxin domain-containing protein [Limnoglobus roseus]QEL17863.1 thioredoxin [Limnoglobus roseus]